VADPLTHTDALAALLREPWDEVLTTLPAKHKCSVCGLPMEAGALALVCFYVPEDHGETRGQVAHRSCRAVLDECNVGQWFEMDTLVERIEDRITDAITSGEIPPLDTDEDGDGPDWPAEPVFLDVVPADAVDEWRAVWATLRGGARG